MVKSVLIAVLAALGPGACYGLENGAALTPPMGYSNWNMWHNNINASLFREVAQFMKDRGFLTAGYNYITLGGIGYANNSQPGGNITRNATGYLQVDPIKFPGGNAGMAKLTDEIRALGYKWGSYTEAGTTGCDGSARSSEGYEDKDAALFFGEWQSEYLMIDSCGVKARPPPQGPPPGYPGGQARWEMTLWKGIVTDWQKTPSGKPVVLHDCHNGCGSTFAGPTLAALPCDPSDPHQHWSVDLTGATMGLVGAADGFCAGCGSQPMGGCANDAANFQNGSGVGLGMEPCLVKCSGDASMPGCGGAGTPDGLGAMSQAFNFSVEDGVLRQVRTGECLELLQPKSAAPFPQVVVRGNWQLQCKQSFQQWTPVPLAATTATTAGMTQLKSKAAPALCLSSAGATVAPNADPWCVENNNMWRSNTDVLQSWTRTMMEVESMANQGTFSRPGAWSFPDCLELGVPGEGVYTWEETKAILALFAVTSSPLILGNDPRPGRMQDRLVDLYLNKDMISVNQQYAADFAGGRLWSEPGGREVWGKPLESPASGVAVVLFNRAGTVVGEIPDGEPPRPPHCTDPRSTLGPCTGCFLDSDKPVLAPCDDNVTASTGAQKIEVEFARLPPAWIGLPGHGQGTISCDIYDIFAAAQRGASLGTFTTSWSATIPPHGAKFLRLQCHRGPQE